MQNKARAGGWGRCLGTEACGELEEGDRAVSSESRRRQACLSEAALDALRKLPVPPLKKVTKGLF